MRVFLKSPVLENGTPGSVRGASGNRRPYRDGAQVGETEMRRKAKLLFICGKMAAGKSTLSRELAGRENAVLLIQDEFLERLYPGEIVDIPGFLKCSSRVKDALTPHICALLSRGVSVVLDFPANTKNQRAWFRSHGARISSDMSTTLQTSSNLLYKGI